MKTEFAVKALNLWQQHMTLVPAAYDMHVATLQKLLRNFQRNVTNGLKCWPDLIVHKIQFWLRINIPKKNYDPWRSQCGADWLLPDETQTHTWPLGGVRKASSTRVLVVEPLSPVCFKLGPQLNQTLSGMTDQIEIQGILHHWRSASLFMWHQGVASCFACWWSTAIREWCCHRGRGGLPFLKQHLGGFSESDNIVMNNKTNG